MSSENRHFTESEIREIAREEIAKNMSDIIVLSATHAKASIAQAISNSVGMPMLDWLLEIFQRNKL